MKNKTTAALLAFFLGWLGVHRFYLGQTLKGVLYLLFCWTFIPTIISLADFIYFLALPDREFNRKYNGAEAGEVPVNLQTQNVFYFGGIGAMLLFFFTMIAIFGGDESPKNDNEVTVTEDTTDPAEEYNNNKDVLSGMINELKDLEPTELNNPTALTLHATMYSAYAKIISENLEHDSTEIKELAAKAKKELVDCQGRNFPKLRKQYVELARKTFWENDIDVSSSGSRTTSIDFVGHLFAANKNKKDFQNELTEVMTLLRFKRSTYRWYKGESEYTYFTFDSKDDKELVIL